MSGTPAGGGESDRAGAGADRTKGEGEKGRGADPKDPQRGGAVDKGDNTNAGRYKHRVGPAVAFAHAVWPKCGTADAHKHAHGHR